ncbi:NAD(P)-dependent dehydrogenase, short-chain alcohol dehydrogenase family [Tistlia consotensis]|uniref:Peroxisomal trans-2-enoyl-CoA reductase n=1 Tax=Tistlia consotensis USBA 355 TaxID=560819 RepID=A0A1Y6CHK4_9PROT|nr:SDR family oxidoreductase [Tistlia consotensis]SMF65895.1 NAD(P)-dependent dehydrogenase, short-chain alcohol dehydrogenase family [Tistlia consotensis USBA 355]SNS02975.1 NAD(P)-dependent dehydrogenase, short-chain alcohol dehydrogenase family [Tistlia consotensis]
MTVPPSGLPEPPPAGRSMLPPGTFEGQVVLITGGGTGLGLGMGLEFARLGATIAVASRKADHRLRGVAAIEAAGGAAIEVALDVREPEAVSAAFARIEAEAGPVSVLVNNAAGNFPVRAERLSPNGWRAVVDIVLTGTFLCSREFARRRVACGAGGPILNVLATYVDGGAPGHAHSAAAKSGVRSLTETLAVEWAPDGIRVNAIAPGVFPHGDHSPDMARNRPEGYEAERTRIPALRTGRLHELGWAATWLCSPHAAFVTGHVLVIDGGERLNYGIRRPVFEPIRERLPD